MEGAEEAAVAAQAVEYGKMAEILVQRAGSSEEFTRLTALTWIHEFVKLGGSQLVPYYAAILGALLPCISDGEEKIRAVSPISPPRCLPWWSPRLMPSFPLATPHTGCAGDQRGADGEGGAQQRCGGL